MDLSNILTSALASLDNDIGSEFGYCSISLRNDESVTRSSSSPLYLLLGRNNSVADEDGMSENNLGRAAVHEVAHYLGLRHIWGDASRIFWCSGGRSVDGGIEDTPIASDRAGCMSVI